MHVALGCTLHPSRDLASVVVEKFEPADLRSLFTPKRAGLPGSCSAWRRREDTGAKMNPELAWNGTR